MTMAVLRIPYGMDGVEDAPKAIVEELRRSGLTEKGHSLSLGAIDAVEVFQDDLDMTRQSIAGAVSHLPDRSIILGGSQQITAACFTAFLRSHPGAGLVLLDAHPDCNPRYSVPCQEDLLLELVNNAVVFPDQILLVGTRAWTAEEKSFLDAHSIQCISMKGLFEYGIKELCDTIMEKSRAWPSFYLSVDMDVVDPACAPGVGVPEPGGLSSRELIYLVQRLSMMKNFGMAEIVEVNPKKDVNGMTVKLAAKIAAELH